MKGRKFNLIEGGDTLIGTNGADRFVLREGQGDLTVEGFQAGTDKVLFDIGGAYSDIMYLGPLYDGLTFDNFLGTATFTINVTDSNGDGLTDTYITANDESITLLGVSPDSLTGASLMGG